MSSCSANAEMSPWMSIILVVGVTRRVCITTLAWGIRDLLMLFFAVCDDRFGIFGQRACFVWIDAHKIYQARDLENLYIMLAQPAGQQLTFRFARARQ